MSAPTADRERQLRRIAAKWPRFAWDFRGQARWRSFDESFWTGILAVGALFAVAYFDLPLWWGVSLPPLPILGGLGGSPGENALLALLLLINAWVLDRHVAGKIPPALSEARWLRWIRRAASTIPLAGLAVVPLWQSLIRNRPIWAFAPRAAVPRLRLDCRLPARLGSVSWQARIDARLHSMSQHFIPQVLWLIGCQLTPLFSGLFLIYRNWPGAARSANVLLHLLGAASATAHVALRSRSLQMTGWRALVFRLLPLALLLPVPFASIVGLIWLPAGETNREDKGAVQTLYSLRSARRHPLASVRGPRLGEILGARENDRRQAAAVKVALLALETAVLPGVAASLGFPLPLEGTGRCLWLLAVASALSGAFLFLAGAVARTSGRWRRFAFLADHPYGVFLTFPPLALALGWLAGTMTGPRADPTLRQLLAVTGLAGILATMLALMWTFLLALFFGAPERPLTGKVACFSWSALLLLLPRLPLPRCLGLVAALTAVASVCSGFVVASQCLAPFRFRDLADRRLPAGTRTLLWFQAATAFLPFGGLATPVWVGFRHLRGPELDRQAAHLREPPP